MIELEISNMMSVKEGVENKLIRMSEELRKELNLSLGEFIIIQNIALQVDKIYKEDFDINQKKAFVTKNTFYEFKSNNVKFEVSKHVTLGCDPEFFLIDPKNNCLFNPGTLVKKQGCIGHDGLLMELRPQPSIEQDIVVNNLYSLIQQFNSMLELRNLSHLQMISQSGGWGLFTGFHVHLGLPQRLLNPQQPDFGKIINIIVKALDYYVGTLSVLVEKEDNSRRCSPFVNYGKVSDSRISQRTLEYRVPGGALLKHPILTSGLLGICSMVTHDLLERLAHYTDNFNKRITIKEDALVKEIYPNMLSSMDMYNVICVPTIDSAEKEAPHILEDFSCMINYKQYKKTIDNFMLFKDKAITSNLWLNWNNMEYTQNA